MLSIKFLYWNRTHLYPFMAMHHTILLASHDSLHGYVRRIIVGAEDRDSGHPRLLWMSWWTFWARALMPVEPHLGVFKFNPTQLKPHNQSNPNRKPIKIAKIWIALDLSFYKSHGLDRISDLIFKTDSIQSKLYNII